MKFAPATADALWLGKVRQARAMSAEARVLAGPRLFAGVCERMKEGIRDPHDQLRFSRRRRLTFLSRDAWLPTPEDVIVQKLRWCLGGRRSKDFDDAVAVMAVQGKQALDRPYIEKWCAEHGTMAVLAHAKAEAALAWDDDETGGLCCSRGRVGALA